MNIQNRRTPLHIAAEKGKLDVVQLLIESGANIEAQDRVSEVRASLNGIRLDKI